ncbi:hypothetical protein BTO04_02335 [Polaribacter sp. SA4-10]|uniref:hypothetical protein n=1 Tax=Polaribacter sp. SA4-10 TaxID=754397 RepID=UPI000B3CFE43|nr:hypothetical protein [Polaribacter sp. SA4-10]ARV05606.1 hypothetical protein BTO04_02335 [Polaribacter sp. SA4-10]
MRFSILIFIAPLLFFSCKQQSEISSDFNCTTTAFNNLEEIVDVKKTFSVKFPKTWKTKLFYDAAQSSIFTADSAKQLTETLLLDITYINKSINFDNVFKLKQEQESLSKNLIQTTSKEIKLLNSPSYYTVSKGKKRTFTYQVCNVFIKLNKNNFILAKTDIYGDSLVQERMCEAFSLIEKIKITQ